MWLYASLVPEASSIFSGSILANFARSRTGKCCTSGVISRDSLARYEQSFAFRPVSSDRRSASAEIISCSGYAKPHVVGFEAVRSSNSLAGSAMLLEGERETVRFQPPICARCKHSFESDQNDFRAGSHPEGRAPRAVPQEDIDRQVAQALQPVRELSVNPLDDQCKRKKLSRMCVAA